MLKKNLELELEHFSWFTTELEIGITIIVTEDLQCMNPSLFSFGTKMECLQQISMILTSQQDWLAVYMNLIDKNSSLDYDGDFHSGFWSVSTTDNSPSLDYPHADNHMSQSNISISPCSLQVLTHMCSLQVTPVLWLANSQLVCLLAFGILNTSGFFPVVFICVKSMFRCWIYWPSYLFF